MAVKHVATCEASHVKRSATVDTVSLHARVAIGASGAATTSRNPDSDFTCAKNGTGTYDLTFPASKNAWINLVLYSPALTVVTWVVTALDASAGTATIKTLAGTNAAAATEPASGDNLYFTIDLER